MGRLYLTLYLPLIGPALSFPAAENGYQLQKDGINRVYQTSQKIASDAKLGAEEGFKSAMERIQRSESEMVKLSTDLFLTTEETNKKTIAQMKADLERARHQKDNTLNEASHKEIPAGASKDMITNFQNSVEGEVKMAKDSFATVEKSSKDSLQRLQAEIFEAQKNKDKSIADANAEANKDEAAAKKAHDEAISRADKNLKDAEAKKNVDMQEAEKARDRAAHDAKSLTDKMQAAQAEAAAALSNNKFSTFPSTSSSSSWGSSSTSSSKAWGSSPSSSLWGSSSSSSSSLSPSSWKSSWKSE